MSKISNCELKLLYTMLSSNGVSRTKQLGGDFWSVPSYAINVPIRVEPYTAKLPYGKYGAALYQCVDFDDIPWDLYNPETNKWRTKNGKAPTVKGFLQQFEEGTHPKISYGEGNSNLLTEAFAEMDAIKASSSMVKSTKEAYVFKDTYGMRFYSVQQQILKASDEYSKALNNIRQLAYVYNNVKTAPYVISNKAQNVSAETPITTLAPDKANIAVKECLVQFALNEHGSWNIDPPHVNELDRDLHDEMLDLCKQHLKVMPTIELTSLSSRFVAYFSDGGFDLTPEAINRTVDKKKIWFSRELGLVYCEAQPTPGAVIINKPCIYFGEAQCVGFNVFGQDYLNGNRVYWATPAQFVKAYETTRPELLKDFKAWGDCIFISSDWCERNGSKNYGIGIDLQTPHQRRLTLFTWIVGPMNSYVQQHQGKAMTGFSVMNGYHNKDRINKLYELTKKAQTSEPVSA